MAEETDGIEEAFEGQVRILVTAAGQVGERLARAREHRLSASNRCEGCCPDTRPSVAPRDLRSLARTPLARASRALLNSFPTPTRQLAHGLIMTRWPWGHKNESESRFGPATASSPIT